VAFQGTISPEFDRWATDNEQRQPGFRAALVARLREVADNPSAILQLVVPFSNLWSCYVAIPTPSGHCEHAALYFRRPAPNEIVVESGRVIAGWEEPPADEQEPPPA
jgi:hypothetical protein